MPKQEGLRFNSLGVTRQVQGKRDMDLAVLSAAALASGLKELPSKYFVDESIFVRGRGAHALESGDGDGKEVAVEADD